MELVLDNIGKRFKTQWLYKDVSIRIPSGSSCAITGANGSGKSTLLQIIYQYVVPTRGSARAFLDGTELTDEQIVSHTGFVAPYLELPEELTLLEAVAFHFRLRPATEKDFGVILSSCGLSGNEHKFIKNFSSGMKQRLKLALAFYTDCKLLLLDEPCSNLDQKGVEWYCDMVKKLSSQRTIIVASNQEIEYSFCTQTLKIEPQMTNS